MMNGKIQLVIANQRIRPPLLFREQVVFLYFRLNRDFSTPFFVIKGSRCLEA